MEGLSEIREQWIALSLLVPHKLSGKGLDVASASVPHAFAAFPAEGCGFLELAPAITAIVHRRLHYISSNLVFA